VYSEQGSFLARAIAVGYCYAVHGKDHNKSKDIRKPDTIRGTQKVEARRISDLARVAWDTPCGKIEAEHFARALNININVFEIHHTFEDVLY